MNIFALPIRPDLTLFDDRYGQDYYTLQSIFGHGHSPPAVHIHVRLLDLASVPLGSIPHPATVPVPPSSAPPSKKTAEVADPSPEEAKVFDDWVRERWTEKDQLLEHFYKTGKFPAKEGEGSEEFQVKILHPKDAAQLAFYSLPGYIFLGTLWTLIKAPFSLIFG